MATSVLHYGGRPARRDRRFQVRAWRPGYKRYYGPFTYHRTRAVARIVATWFAVFGYRVELWDMGDK